MSIYETMADGLCGIMRYASKEDGRIDEEFPENKDKPEDIIDNSEAPHEDNAYEVEEMDGDKNKGQEPDGVVWHASPSSFDEFLFKEIGFHFAETKELAQNAAELSGKRNAVVKPYRISYTNMVEVSGQKNGFRGHELVEDMLNRGYISKDQYEEALNALYDFEENYDEYEDREIEKLESKGYYGPFDAYNQAEATVLKKFFDEWGIDALKYWNTFDAYGLGSLFGDKMMQEMDEQGTVKPNWSYIVFDNDQITPL